MITFDIPNRTAIVIEHLVLDFNGTLAIDGQLIEGVVDLLSKLSEHLSIHVITADTFGTVKDTFANTSTNIKIIEGKEQGRQKADFVASLNPQSVVAIGNGANDSQMLKLAGLGIVVIQAEGASIQPLVNADIACVSIIDALQLLLYPRRITATLRV